MATISATDELKFWLRPYGNISVPMMRVSVWDFEMELTRNHELPG